MNSTSRRVGLLLTAVAAIAVGATATACDAGPVAPAPTNPIQTAPSFTPVPPPTGPSAAAIRQLKFPNTNEQVLFTGYDTTVDMAEFQEVVQDPSAKAAHLVPDPSDPGIHRLPMKPGTKVESFLPNGFPFEVCPPTSCTTDQIMQSVISHYPDAFWATIHVNAADQIDMVQQMDY